MMRYPKVMPRSAAVALVCVFVGGCATSQGDGQATAIELAVAQDDDLGDPRPSPEARQAARDAQARARAQAIFNDPNATHLDFDGDDPNDAPVDMVVIPPDRSPSRSMIQDITMGPS